jgi:cell division septum initiation protein DivIVA
LISRKAEQELFDSQGFAKKTSHYKRVFDFMVFMHKLDAKAPVEENVAIIIEKGKRMDHAGPLKETEGLKGQLRRLEKINNRFKSNMESLEKEVEELRKKLDSKDDELRQLQAESAEKIRALEEKVGWWSDPANNDSSLVAVAPLSPHRTTVRGGVDRIQPAGEMRISFADAAPWNPFRASKNDQSVSFLGQIQELKERNEELEREAEGFQGSLKRLSVLEGRLTKIRRRIVGKSDRSFCLNESSMDFLAPNAEAFQRSMSELWITQIAIIFSDDSHTCNSQAKKLLLSLMFWELTCRFNFTLFEFIDSPSSDHLEEVKAITDFYDSCCGAFSRYLWDDTRTLPQTIRQMTFGEFIADSRASPDRTLSFGEGREWSIWTRIIPLYDMWTDFNE